MEKFKDVMQKEYFKALSVGATCIKPVLYIAFYCKLEREIGSMRKQKSESIEKVKSEFSVFKFQFSIVHLNLNECKCSIWKKMANNLTQRSWKENVELVILPVCKAMNCFLRAVSLQKVNNYVQQLAKVKSCKPTKDKSEDVMPKEYFGVLCVQATLNWILFISFNLKLERNPKIWVRRNSFLKWNSRVQFLTFSF